MKKTGDDFYAPPVTGYRLFSPPADGVADFLLTFLWTELWMLL